MIPLVCTSGNDGLTVAARSDPGSEIVTLPQQLASDGGDRDEVRRKQRAGLPARTPAALRYYDEERDYQTGVQRATGARQAGRELMIDLPATLTASGARQLANDSANRARWQHETVTWRIGELDPRVAPGSIVRLPHMPGQWLLRSWEWLDRGIALELERLAPGGGTPRTADAGESIPPTDLPVPTTHIALVEIPSEAGVNSAPPRIFAAASAANSAWRGAALYAVQGSALVELGTTGTQRTVLGTLDAPLGPSPALLLESRAEVIVALVADDLSFSDSDLAGLAAGANRLLIGGELVQFSRAQPLGSRRWRLSGLLRGRGGTEPAAVLGHRAGTPVILLDDSLVPLDPILVPPLGTSRIAAIGTGDTDPVVATLANPGLSRRPLRPVHPRITSHADGATSYRWTRRARGQWRWDDSVEVPLVEEREAYLVGFGPTEAPYAAWQREVPAFVLTASERTNLLSTFGAAALWVRQVGTFDRSPPLLLADLS